MTKLPKSKRLLPLVALVLTFIVFIGLGVTLIDTGTVSVYSSAGAWDLTDVDLSLKSVRLRGDVCHVPHALLSPEDYELAQDRTVYGDTTGLDVVTSRFRIYVADGGWYTFSNLLLGYSHRLYVNGQWLMDVGTFEEAPDAARPGTARVIFTAQPVDGVIELHMQSLTYLHRVDDFKSYWYIGDQSLIPNVRRVDFVSSLVLGCFLTMFLIYVMLYLLRRDYIANLYIALFSLSLLLRFGVREPSIFSAVFMQLDWYTEFRIEYVTVPVMGWLLTAVATELLPTIVPKYFRATVYIASFLFAVIFLFGDAAVANHVMFFCYIFYMLAILYQMAHGLYTVIKNLNKINLEQAILVFGFALLLFTILYAYDNYSGVNMLPASMSISAMQIIMITHVLFCFCIAAAVFISSTKDMEASKAAEFQLAAEVNSLIRINEMKTEVMANISHEARTPLAVLASYSGLVAMELKDRNENEQIVANLDKIVEEAKRVANLIESMNKFTLDNDKPNRRVLLNLGEAIKQTAGLYHHIYKRSGITLTLSVADNLMVFANPEEVTQVLFNLLQNAKDHGEQTSVSVTAAKQNGNVMVIINDTGTGVPPDLLPRLFERGVSGTKFGKGIGLAICKEVMDAHGGSITITSETTGAHKGTQVTLIWPESNMNEEDGNGDV